MLDDAYEKEKAAIEQYYEPRISNSARSGPTASRQGAGGHLASGSAERTGSVLTRDELVGEVAKYRSQGKRIVFTNGCFDLIHRGHTGYLTEAKGLGDILIIGLNGDESVRRIKGEGRPVLAVRDRAEILVALRSVDHVVVFDEDTAEDLVDIVQPDIYVKGGDYSPEYPTPEARRAAAYGGSYHVLSYIESTSTSQLITRIVQSGK